MQLGMIGLGRMGGNMTKRLGRAGHDVKTYDPGVDSTAGDARRSSATSSTRRARSG